MQRAFGSVSIPVIAVALACTASAAPPRSTTLDSTPRLVTRLAQDGQWLAHGRDCGGLSFTVRNLRTGRSWSPVRCGTGDGLGVPQLALAAGRTLWNLTDTGNSTYERILTASPGRRPSQVAELIFDNSDSSGEHLGAIAGDGPTLVFSSLRVRIDPPDCDVGGGEICGNAVEGGRVWRVVGAKRVAVPGAPPSYLLAAWQRRIALVAADDVFAPRRFGRAVEVRDSVTGRLVSRSAPAGQVQAIALAPRYVALLVGGPAGRRIERRAAATGALLGKTPVPRSVKRISASSYGVVFIVGRSIRVVDARTGRTRTVATTRAMPVGASIEANRVVWAERVGSRRVIRALGLRR